MGISLSVRPVDQQRRQLAVRFYPKWYWGENTGREYYDFARAINCTRKLTCVCAYACACDRTRLREQYEAYVRKSRYSKHGLGYRDVVYYK